MKLSKKIEVNVDFIISREDLLKKLEIDQADIPPSTKYNLTICPCGDGFELRFSYIERFNAPLTTQDKV